MLNFFFCRSAFTVKKEDKILVSLLAQVLSFIVVNYKKLTISMKFIYIIISTWLKRSIVIRFLINAFLKLYYFELFSKTNCFEIINLIVRLRQEN